MLKNLCERKLMTYGVVRDQRYKINVKILVKGDEVIVDFTGSDKQASGAINCTYGVTASATYNAMLQVTDSSVPRNVGCYRQSSLSLHQAP